MDFPFEEKGGISIFFILVNIYVYNKYIALLKCSPLLLSRSNIYLSIRCVGIHSACDARIGTSGRGPEHSQ